MIDSLLQDDWFLNHKEIEKAIHFLSLVKKIPEEKILNMTVKEVEKILDEMTTDEITIKDLYLFSLSMRKKKKTSLLKKLVKIFRR